ncbi:hypothetical protein BP1258A_2081 [Burkholderia pseudomallei 1258a]|nr:hypothetical protein BP1258A_2081 [Burkholderia pseudomallei 1258a]EIF65152.1 hypothetical protein BP1258B_2256 [Burkholderia pseudomallei 1258b]EIF73219.1 hypothetical protein BP354A_5794 [Burkholderia pseudomallei 354a]EIF75998.1 hypothetical protein BP354E_1996 [Burkholderia pseudomallei 354e]
MSHCVARFPAGAASRRRTRPPPRLGRYPGSRRHRLAFPRAKRSGTAPAAGHRGRAGASRVRLASDRLRCDRLPLRGQRRLARPWRTSRPASRLTAREAREHRGGASLGARAPQRQGAARRRRTKRRAASRPRDRHQRTTRIFRGEKRGCYV